MNKFVKFIIVLFAIIVIYSFISTWLEKSDKKERIEAYEAEESATRDSLNSKLLDWMIDYNPISNSKIEEYQLSVDLQKNVINTNTPVILQGNLIDIIEKDGTYLAYFFRGFNYWFGLQQYPSFNQYFLVLECNETQYQTIKNKIDNDDGKWLYDIGYDYDFHILLYIKTINRSLLAFLPDDINEDLQVQISPNANQRIINGVCIDIY